MGATLFAPGLMSPPAIVRQEREPAGFAEFWRAYPRKVGKGAARPAFVKAMRKTSLDVILTSLAHTRWPSDQQFIPHPATWLNGERFWDETDNVDPVLRAAGL